MTREEAREFLINISYKLGNMSVEYLSEKDGEKMREAIKALDQEPVIDNTEQCMKAMKATDRLQRWIPVSERLPEELEPVNITWINHNPESYYADIKDKPFTATAHYYKGRWYWYSSTCQDYLEEYGRCDVDEIDTDIEVIAWMPLPKPYEPQESEGK